MPQASTTSASVGSTSVVPPSAGIQTTTSPWSTPVCSRTSRPSSEPRSRKACGTALRLSMLLTSKPRTDRGSATTTTSRKLATALRDHSWTNSATVRWNSSSRSIHGLST